MIQRMQCTTTNIELWGTLHPLDKKEMSIAHAHECWALEEAKDAESWFE